MPPRALGEDDRRRLREEREAADRRYNDALTHLDRAIQSGHTALPEAPPAVDEQLVTPVNERWQILAAPPETGTGWRGRLVRLVWRTVAPFFERQQRFNAALVEHLNRNLAGERQAREALASTVAAVRGQIDQRAAFDSSLIQFLQEITAYVDTRDREIRASVLADPHEQTRAVEQALGLVQQQLAALKREFERATHVRSAGLQPGQPNAGLPAGPAHDQINAYKYVGFEDRFRGTERDIRSRFAAYASLFAGASDVLDVGCGRGEFLGLLREQGVTARGVELNHEMAELCRARGLDVTEGDAAGYLEGLPDGAIGGLFAAQVVEHLEPGYLMRFLELAYDKLRPGSRIVLETINVDCWSAFFGPYLRDVTHVRPLPPETLRFLLTASGFQRVDTRAASPVAESARLRRLGAAADADAAVAATRAVIDENVDKLNALLFTHFDYAAIAERL